MKRLLIAVFALCTFIPQTAKADPERMEMNLKPRLLTENGGRVDWYKGSAPHNLIVYDAPVRRGQMEVLLINADGSGKTCLTCRMNLPGPGMKGQPVWHPDGEHLIIQVENEKSGRKSFQHPSFGFENDLWLITRDGRHKEKIWSTPKNHAALHPQLSPNGRTLIFAERQPTGESRWIWRNLTPGGENHWDGWRIHIADIDISKSGERVLSNHRRIQPNGTGMYETHQITPDGRIIYSFTPDGKPYVDAIYSVRMDGTDVRHITGQGPTWNEHGLYSPDGKRMAWMSSRFNKDLIFPKHRAKDLQTELYISEGAREYKLTNFNQTKDNAVVSDFSWGPDSKSFVLQVADIQSGTAELWIQPAP